MPGASPKDSVKFSYAPKLWEYCYKNRLYFSQHPPFVLFVPLNESGTPTQMSLGFAQ